MNKITLFIFFFCVNFINAQSSWKKINSENYKAKTELAYSKTSLNSFDLYALDTNTFKEELTSQKTIMIPINGNLANFYIEEASIFTDAAITEYEDIKSFSLKGIDDKTATGKISLGTDGIHAIIFSGKHSTIYIDPYTKNKATYIAYQKEDISNSDSDFKCLVDETMHAKKITSTTSQKNANDSVLRTYRLALACTIEYSNFHLGNQGISDNASDAVKKAAILSAMNTTITRINGIFEKEIAVTLNIVTNNGENELIFLDEDNLSNEDPFELIDESQEICDDIIGTANYDIGHTFSTGAGGLASLAAVCSTNIKGSGVTGRANPIGDTFDIDFVAHELGHQFGANHTFNGTLGNCDDVNRNNPTSVEPGSGSTIMGYASLCSSQNIQNSSDDYFHAISIDQMWTVIQNTSCATETNLNNMAPVVNAGADFSVPKSTPLILRGEATDVDSDNLTYCWEQIDTGVVISPPLDTNIAGASFRSFPPNYSPNRYLPVLSTVIGGDTQSEWEVLPSVAREMNFSLVVRDNNVGGGASERDDMSINVIDTDPFIITSQNTAVNWDIGTTETITWDTSTTNQAPINCANVKITLSLDEGKTFPITLVESTPNDGSYNTVVPNQLTSSARIMVEGVDHIFYNVNSTNFSIISSGPTFILSNLSENQEICDSEAGTINYILDVDYINDFSETVNFSIEDLPTGVNAVLSPESLTESGEITISLSNFENTTTGIYNMTITGTSTTLTSSIELSTLTINNNNFQEIILTSPQNNTSDAITENLTLTWENSLGTNTAFYNIEIASDSNFNTILFSEENLTINSFTFTEVLEWNTTYYWRVKAKNNCGESDYSTTYTFTTEDEAYCSSTFTSLNDSEFITNVSFGAIDNDSGDDNLSEVANGYEDFTNITTTLIPGSTYNLKVTIDPVGFQDHCYAFMDWNNDSRFDTATERYDLGSVTEKPTTINSDILIPQDAVLGETRMRIIIEYFDDNTTFGNGACDADHNSEFGETEDYSLIISNNVLSLDDVFENFSIYPNPIENDNFTLLFNVPFTEESVTLNLFDFTGRVIMAARYDNSSSLFNENIKLKSLRTGIYFLNITNGSKETTKKLIIR